MPSKDDVIIKFLFAGVAAREVMQRVWLVLAGEGSVWYNPVLRKHALAPFKRSGH